MGPSLAKFLTFRQSPPAHSAPSRGMLSFRLARQDTGKEGSSTMSRHHAVCLALVSSVLAFLLQGAAPKQQLGEIVGADVYTTCEYRIAAQLPSEPKFRNITYRDGARTAP